MAALLVATALYACGCQRHPDVTLELIADDLVFRGDNPDICAPPGARVRVVFRNQADGVIHDLAIPELDVATGILSPGESADLDFTAPDSDVVLTYACKLHALMRGRILIKGATQADPNQSATASDSGHDIMSY